MKIKRILKSASRPRSLIIIISLIVVGFIVYQFIIPKSPNKDIAKVKKGSIKEELTLSGSIDADEHATLVFPMSGRLAWVGVKLGDKVSKNQGIASLDQRTALKTLQGALLDFTEERRVFDKVQKDNNNNTPNSALNDAMKRVLENNQYNLDKAVVSVELQDLARQQSYLYTPIDGVVTRADALFAGANAIMGSTTYEVINPNTIYFAVSADQTDVVNFTDGQNCNITLDAYPNEILNGTIRRISFTPKTDETGTVYKVEVNLTEPNFEYKYRLGMTGDATFIAKQRINTLLLPLKFVKTDDKGTYVFINQKGTKKYIKTGIENDTDIEIINGLSEGETVYD